MKKILFVGCLVACNQVLAGYWYAAPNAGRTGNGSKMNPWPLQMALTSTSAIKPGDTLYLRGGNYLGPGFSSTLTGVSNNYITVRSYPGEWAVVTDGGIGTLGTALNPTAPGATTVNVAISNSQNWNVLVEALIDGEDCQLSTKSGTNWTLMRGWNGTTPTNHAIGARVDLRADFIAQNGSYVAFRDFEICSTYNTNRIGGITNNNGYVHYVNTNSIANLAGLNLLSNGKGNKAINLIIHNVGHPGIGFWDQNDGGEINGCLVWGTGVYDNAGTWTRGSAVYGHNNMGSVLMKNNIFFDDCTEGANMYGTGTTVTGVKLQNNITMRNGNGIGLAIWDATIPTTNNFMWTNYIGLDKIIWGYTSVSNVGASCLGNVFVKPPDCTFVKYHTSGDVEWNTWLFDDNHANLGMFSLGYPQFALTNMSFTIDHNTYYWTNDTTDLFGLTTLDHPAGGGKLTFSQWQSQSGFDANSTCQATWPTNYLNIVTQPLDYDPNQWHVCVINTTTATNATLDLSTLGFASGQGYRLRDAQNYFTIIASGTYTSGTISLPLTLTNISYIPGVTNFVPQHTDVANPGLFNAFVLERMVKPLAPPSGLGVIH